MSLSMPGAFPGSWTHPLQQQEDIPTTTAAASFQLDANYLRKFQTRKGVSQKTRHQQLLIAQLEALVYILVGYQFIKYCHSACIIPVIFHMAVQKVLSCDSITSASTNYSGVHIIREVIARHIRDSQNNADGSQTESSVAAIVLARCCLLVYYKFLVTCLYHILFVCFWALLVAETGRLRQLEHGTWWVISFIGESVPPGYDSGWNFWYKVSVLGLPGLLFSDLVILAVQLVLFQAVYKQSTVSPLGVRLGEQEVDIVRGPTDTGLDSSALFETETGVPLILRIKLYETFAKEAFIADLG